MLSSWRAPRSVVGLILLCMGVSETAAVLVRSCRDGGRRSRPLKSWRFIGVSSLLYKPDLDAPNGYVHQTVQRNVYLEGLCFFVKRKAVEYCEQRLKSKYTTVIPHGIIEQLKKKNEVLLDIRRAHAGRKTKASRSKRLRLHSRKPSDDSAQARSKVTRCASDDSHREVIARGSRRDRSRSITRVNHSS